MPKVKVQGGSHFRIDEETGALREFEPGAVFNATQKEIDKFSDKLVLVEDPRSKKDGSQEFQVVPRPNSDKFDVVDPSGTVINPDDPLEEAEARQTADKLNKKRTGSNK